MSETKIINRVIDRRNNTTLLDLTPDTVTESNLLHDETAHNREGEPIEGELDVITDYDQLNNLPKINHETITGDKTGADYHLIDASEKGEANGVATLNENGQIPSDQLPSYVDSVVNGYRNTEDGLFYEESTFETPIEGEEGIIYVDLLSENTYRWSDSIFVEISKSLSLGETQYTAYAGDKGKANADAIEALQKEETLHPKQPIVLASALAIGGYNRTTVEGALGALNEYKVDKVEGKGLSTEDFTTEEKERLAGVKQMVGATSMSPGEGGLVPTPTPGDNNKVLFGNGHWDKVVADQNDEMEGATASANGAHGLVPAPQAGEQDNFLKGDGTWSVLPEFQGVGGSFMSISGLVPPAHIGDEHKALLGNGEWGEVATDILDEDGTTYPQRSKLQFNGAIVSDDETNNATVVETVNPVEYEEDIHGVNLLNVKPQTVGGVTFSVDASGYITADVSDLRVWSYANCNAFVNLKAGKYKVKASQETAYTQWYAEFRIYKPDGTIVFRVNQGDQWNSFIANGGEFTLSEDALIGVEYKVGNGSYAFAIYKDKLGIEDYRKFNEQSIQHQLTDQTNVLGAKNLAVANQDTTTTKGTATFTLDTDGVVTVNKSTADTEDRYFKYMEKQFKMGSYIISGCNGGSDSTYRLILRIRNASNTADEASAYCNNGDTAFTVPEDDRVIRLYIEVRAAKTLSNQKFYPMLRLASDPDNTYVPYAMTNRELTEGKLGVEKVLTSSDDLNNIIETGLYAIRGNSPVNTPENQIWMSMLVNTVSRTVDGTPNNIQQQLFKSGVIYQRSYSGSPLQWQPWYKFTGTQLS